MPRTLSNIEKIHNILGESYEDSDNSGEHNQESISVPRLNTSKRTGAAKRKSKTPKRKVHVLKDIKRLQNSTTFLIPRQPFMRLVRELFSLFSSYQLRITPVAIEALQESTEIYMTYLFQDSYACTLHRDRKTLMVKDMQLVRYLRGQSDPGNS